MYAKIKDGSVEKYPYVINDLKMDNKNVSFPVNALSNSDIQAQYNFVEVVQTAMPDKPGWKVSSSSPKLIDGVWTLSWEQVPKVESELTPEDIEDVEMPVQEGYTAIDSGAEWKDDKWVQKWNLVEDTYKEKRIKEYGSGHPFSSFDYLLVQLEYIVENGLDAWQTRVNEIKDKYPK